MLVGIPAAVVSALVPDAVAAPLCEFMALPVRWVAGVASAGARIEPRGPAAFGAWTVVAVTAVLWARRHRAVAG
jgi:hypothetical protein